MLSLQETINKTEKQLKAIKESMEAKGCYHPDDASLYSGLNVADRYEVEQVIKSVSLAEFLAKTSSTSSGAYLIAAKLHDDLIMFSKKTDIVPLISAHMASQWDGGDLQVNIVDDQSYKPTPFSSGGKLASSNVNVMKPSIVPISFGVDVNIGNDMIEDNQYDLIAYHIQKAALTMGEYASEMALTVLKTATDGWGTVNSGLSGNDDETKMTGATTTDIADMIEALTVDRWIANTLVITTHAWNHSVKSTGDTLASNIPTPYSLPPVAEGFQCKVAMPPLDVLFCDNDALHEAGELAGSAMTNCVTIVCDRNNALFTGRKRWLEVLNYAHPIEDLAGAVISARQDSVTL